MKPTEKDIKEANDYIQIKLSEHSGAGAFMILESSDDFKLNHLLAEYVLHLEAKGIIKFTANREQHPEYINCSDCERKNCYYNKFCVGCGRKMPHHA